MSKFEVQLTPTRIKQMRKLEEVRAPTDVLMGPFTPKVVVAYLDIPVSKIARRFLTIHNRYDDETQIQVTKGPKPELNITLEWTSNNILSSGSINMEISWSPVKSGTFKETLKLTDSKGNVKEIYLQMRSVELKKAVNKKTLLAPSLSKKLKASPQKAIVNKTVVQKKANILINSNQENQKMTPVHSKTRPLGESNLNASNIFDTKVYSFPNLDTLFEKKPQGDNFDKENMSPATPPHNPFDFIDNLRFTPTSVTIPREESHLEYLASLPTPKATDYKASLDVKIKAERLSVSKFGTPLQMNASDISVLAQMPTPKGLHDTTNKSNIISNLDATPFQGNATTFEPHVFSTLTKACNKKVEMEFGNQFENKQLFTEDSPILTIGNNGYKNENDRLSTETYVIASNLERLSSETYTKCIESPLLLHEEEIHLASGLVMDKTRSMTPPPLSIIVEESEMDGTGVSNVENLASKTFNIKQEINSSPQKHKKAVEELVLTPLSRRMISQSSKNITKQDRDIMNLRTNQGSMPNLADMKVTEQLRSIENNRYFYQKPISALNLNNLHDESMINTTSNLDTMFRESEIQAQSSQLNLNEIDTSTENTPVMNKTVTKHKGMAPALSCFDFTKSSDCMETSGSSTGSYKKSVPKISISSPQLNRPDPPSSAMTFSPPKNIQVKDGFIVPNAASRTKTWGAKKPKKLNMQKYPMKLTLQPATPKARQEERVIFYNPELHISGFINPDPFAATTTIDPFLSSSMYLDECTTDKHEKKFKTWLNALVTIPADLDSNTGKIDVGKLFNEVQNKNQAVPAPKELVVSKYYKTRFDCLRAAAIKLYQSREVSEVLTKLLPQIEKNAIQIREDRDLHLQIGLQQQVLDLLFSFNTLWLRLALEIVFGEIIPMTSNTDLFGLTRFIIDRMFKDTYLEKKYTKYQTLSETYKEQVKKHTLKKFFCLLYFLDNAKNKRIIKQNPCLFVKSSPYKETREVLLKFSSMLLCSVGDVSKYLKRFGYVLTHKQMYLDEFDYAFNNLAVDLRDGVRLTKIMEIILLREDLSTQLRVPAISRMQKVHNVDVAIKALAAADYKINGDITPKDIADGHREKTLSLLWQIIYKFRAPKFHAASITIQKWWRLSWLRVCIARRIEEKKRKRLESAAIILQRNYRGYIVRKWFKHHRENVLKACVVLQKNFRRHMAVKKYKILKLRKSQEYCATKIQSILRMKYYRKKFILARKATIVIQLYFRGYLQMQEDRKSFLAIKKAALSIQRRFRANLEMKRTREVYCYQRQLIVNIQQKYRATLKMRAQRKSYLLLRQSTMVIQTYYRATQLMKIDQAAYLEMQESTIVIQRRYRAQLAMRGHRKNYLTMKKAAIVIQKYYRGYQLMKKQQMNYIVLKLAVDSITTRYRALISMRKAKASYLEIKSAATLIQRKLRATLAMKAKHKEYLLIKSSTIKIQNWYKAHVKGRKVRKQYLLLIKSCIVIQRQFRANLAMKQEIENYQKMRRSCITIQKFYKSYKLTQLIRQKFLKEKRSSIVIQRQWRATLAMRHQRVEYLSMQFHATIIQERFRGYLLMKNERQKYLNLKHAALCFQKRYRAQVAMKKQKYSYLKIQNAVNILQKKFRANQLMKQEVKSYKKLKKSVVSVQQQYRALQAMKRDRKNYLTLKQAAINVQNRFRANLQMRSVKNEYNKLKKAVKIIQIKYRAQRQMKKDRLDYEILRKVTVQMQARVRGNQQMKRDHQQYFEMKNASIIIQRHWKATLLMKNIRFGYLKKKRATIVIQRRFRALISMKKQRYEYLKLRHSVINVQHRSRALRVMQVQRQEYLRLKRYTIVIQQQYRALIAMRSKRQNFVELKSAAKTIQIRFRALQMGRAIRKEYLEKKHAAIIIQKQLRSVFAMRKTRQEYNQLKNATIVIQQRYRAFMSMLNERNKYQKIQKATVKIQIWYRSILLMKNKRQEYLRLKRVTINTQHRFRAQKAMQKERKSFLQLHSAVVNTQNRWRALLKMRVQRIAYIRLTSAAITIQTRYRALLQMRHDKSKYECMKQATILIQNKFRATQLMKRDRIAYLELLCLTITIQQRYRALAQMKATRHNYLRQKQGAILIQRRFRSYLVMKKIRWEFLRKKQACALIQQKFRANKLAIDAHKKYLNLKEFTIRFQTRIRGFLDRKAYQAKLTPEMLENRRQHKAAKKIQAVWRGFNCRKKHQTVQLKKISQRLIYSRKTMKRQDTVKNQVMVAVNTLNGSYKVNEAIIILKRIERLSRVIPQVLIPHSAFIASFCYGLMAQTIRSEPDKQVIESCACIILNLSRYPPTKEVAFSDWGLMTLAQMLLRWCDKECGIFITLCTLVWIFGHNPEMNEKIRKFMVTQDAIYMLRETKKLTIRKENMRRTINKQFIGSQWNVGLCSNAIDQLPNLEPDYGLIKGKPYVFMSPVFALDTVLELFNVGV